MELSQLNPLYYLSMLIQSYNKTKFLKKTLMPGPLQEKYINCSMIKIYITTIFLRNLDNYCTMTFSCILQKRFKSIVFDDCKLPKYSQGCYSLLRVS
jgi:hypothetical protein